ncbi:hypothetical protein SAMN05192562_11262 [Kosakonia arachidis]|uniref:Uncharacterized protein n=1 Tax=Kosakonia arachidis TaxID=551989 RepID=A0A1I7E8N6_9ENTR|nr:hypothetical protein SAMN05192562_11262 [Kosakonia arachidis]
MSMTINIVSSTDRSQCGVSAFGHEVFLISNTERNKFQLFNGQLNLLG